VIVKRIIYLTVAALVAMLVLVPAALAQEQDPYAPEPNAIEVGSHAELEQIAGQPIPSPDPGPHPGEVPTEPGQPLPTTGGLSVTVLLPAAAVLLVGSGVLAYTALGRRGSR
jgi:hypothetical protein